MTPAEFRAARDTLGITQERMAALLGYDGGKTTIYRKEQGLSPVTRRDALAVESLLRREPDARRDPRPERK